MNANSLGAIHDASKIRIMPWTEDSWHVDMGQRTRIARRGEERGADGEFIDREVGR